MSHTSLRSAGSLTLAVVAGALIAGCGAGRQTQALVPVEPTPTPTVASAAPVPAPPVFGTQKATQAPAPVTGGAEAGSDKIAAQKAEHRRQVAQRKLRHERNAAERAQKRAAQREKALRKQLAAARAKAKAKGNATPQRTPVDPTITASDVPINTAAQHNTEARAAVVRFHELLDGHDAAACALMTAKLLHEVYGKEAGALDRCRAAVAGLTMPVSVVMDASAAKGSRAWVHVTSKVGETEVRQTLRLVLVNGTWLLDAFEQDPAS